MGNFTHQNTSFYTIPYEYLLFRNYFCDPKAISNFVHIIVLLNWDDYYANPQRNNLRILPQSKLRQFKQNDQCHSALAGNMDLILSNHL